MKKNKFLIILTLIITLFSFSSEVNAEEDTGSSGGGKGQEQELTCLYKKGKKKQILLIQYATGTKKVYTNDDGADIEAKDGKSWTEFEYDYLQFMFNVDENGIKDADFLSSDVFNNTNKDIKDKIKNYEVDSIKNFLNEEDAELDSCPKSATFSGDVATFYGEKKDDPLYQYSKTFNKVIEPSQFKSETIEGETKGKTCSQIGIENLWEKWDKKTYVASCLYYKDLDAGCHSIQVSVGQNGSVEVTLKDPTDGAKIGRKPTALNYDVISLDFDGWCPIGIYVLRAPINTPVYDGMGGIVEIFDHYETNVGFTNYEENANYSLYTDYEVDGKKLNDPTKDQSKDIELDIQFTDLSKTIVDCETLLGNSEELIEMLHTVIVIVKIASPIMLIALGIVDFAQAVFAGNEDKMKKAQQRFIKRLIISVVIFLIPSILKLLLTVANSIWPYIDKDLCGIL